MIRRLVFATLFFAATVSGQAPHEAWRTIVTPHFRVHYPAQYEGWATRAAERLESVRSAVVAEVGFSSATVTDVVVENPAAEANGLTIALLDTPRIVLFAEPPGPESEIGEYSDWIDLLTVHETAHLIHLLRPSRNPFERMLERVLPLDPIILHAPRWVLEGYATVIEGRITGSGRPSSAMRAAVLRTWAMNGQLPTYAQLDSDRRFLGMSMAYLAGSAFLEWLVERSGRDSLRHLWARMTARQRRSFDEAFTGVFGDSPRRLYGRFTAELSQKAMTMAGAGGGWVEGELWQETAHRSGEPAVSPDGTKLTMVLRNEKGEATLVVYGTGRNDAEEKNEKRIAEMMKRDPQDVAPLRTKPFPRKPLQSFRPSDDGDLDHPRWTRDGVSIIYTHKQPDSEGFLHSDLFRWTPSTGRNERLTRIADVKDADPIDGTHAVAVRNRFGSSQVVTVDLTTGEVTPRTPPSLDIVYSHPRAAGGRMAWAEHANGEWRVAIDGKPLAIAGAFAPEWGANGALFAAVSRSGFIDIARMDIAISPAYVTRSASMAYDPAPSPDGSLFFMSLDPDGFELRRIADSTSVAPPPATFDRSLVPALPPLPATPVALRDQPVSSRPYGLGRQEWSSAFGGQYTPFGSTTEFGARLGDVIGRLDTLIIGAIGTRAMPRGAAIATVWRGLPIELGAHLFDSRDAHGLELRAGRDVVFPLSRLSISGGGLLDQHRSRAFFDARFAARQRRVASEWIGLTADSANHIQANAHASVRAAGLTFGATISEGRHLTLGGIASTIEPDSLLIERILDPAFQRGTLSAANYRGERLSITASGISAFWQRHHFNSDLDLIGVETKTDIPPIPLVKTPGLQLTAGVARIRTTRKTRGWVGVRWRP
jgi:hypothetical protein